MVIHFVSPNLYLKFPKFSQCYQTQVTNSSSACEFLTPILFWTTSFQHLQFCQCFRLQDVYQHTRLSIVSFNSPSQSLFSSPFLKNSLSKYIKMTHQMSLIQQQLQHQITGFPNIDFYQIGKVFNLFLKISDNFWLGPHPGGWVWCQAGGVQN